MLRIVDRKKDLVKLQLGEYVSLGKVEALLKTHPLVENICVYGDSFRSFIVALVVPSRAHLVALAHRKLGKTTDALAELCEDADVEREVLKELTEHARKSKQVHESSILPSYYIILLLRYLKKRILNAANLEIGFYNKQDEHPVQARGPLKNPPGQSICS